LKHRLSVGWSLLAALLKLHNPPTNLPVRRCHEGIDSARTRKARSFQQLADTTHQTGVVTGNRVFSFS
jgi:hypothetical protein